MYEWQLPEDRRPAIRLAEARHRRPGARGDVHRRAGGRATGSPSPPSADLDDDAARRAGERRRRRRLRRPGVRRGGHGRGADSPEQSVVPATWRLGPLVRAVAERLAERALVLNVHRSSVVVQGNVVTIDGEPVVLTDTEAQLLTVLATRPNVVHSKPDLLRLVWRDETVDPHVVEVAITASADASALSATTSRRSTAAATSSRRKRAPLSNSDNTGS